MAHGTAAAVLFILLAAGVVFGQDTGNAQGEPRRVLLLVTQAGGSGYDADGLSLVYRSVLLGLQTDPEVRAAGTIIVQAPARSAPGSDDARTEAAQAGGADAWLWIEISRTPEGAGLRMRSFDIARQSEAISQAVVMGNRLSLLDLPSADWSGAAHLVAQAFPPLRADAEGMFSGPTSARLSIHTRPGSSVQVAGGPKVTADADGTAAVTIAVPAEYGLRATAPGYSPATRQVYVTGDQDVTLLQNPGARWAVEASLVDVAYPGLGLSWFAVPDSVFLGIGATTYFFGLAMNNQQVFLSEPLTNVYFRTGFYLAPADSPFRVYAALAQFLRIVHAPVYFGLDPLSPAGTELALGVEIARTLRGGFFLEYVPTMYLTTLPTLFRAVLGASIAPRGWLFMPDFALNLLSLRMGYRWMP